VPQPPRLNLADPVPCRRPRGSGAAARWRLLAAAIFASLVAIAGFAERATASRPFSYSVLHRSTDPRKLHFWLLIKTVTGPDQPRRVTARADGVRAPAKELASGRGRWIVSRRTPKGAELIQALRSELRESDHAALRALGHYKCGATFRVRFRLTEFNDRAPSHFEDATGCA